MNDITLDVIKIFSLGTISFLLAFSLIPALSHFLYKHKLWKKKPKEKALDGTKLEVSKESYKKDKKVPRIGGLIVWMIPLFLAFLFFLLAKIFDQDWIRKIDFLSRDQTWIPLFTLVSASLIGLIDDLLQILEKPANGFLNWFTSVLKPYMGEGLRLKHRIILVTLIGLMGGYWFYFKLDYHSILIPFFGDFYLGYLFIPFFIIVMLATYSGSVIDGLDGLSGGTFAAIFTAFGVIAFSQGQINLASFCLVITGSILAFLWFNIPPARFYMGETGILGLTTTVSVIAFLTQSVMVLPIIGILLLIESGSVILQVLSKKYRGVKLFEAAPIHHHFESLGWPHYKVTMRFWIIGAIAAIIGVTIRLLA